MTSHLRLALSGVYRRLWHRMKENRAIFGREEINRTCQGAILAGGYCRMILMSRSNI
jgi:hypothetical protein